MRLSILLALMAVSCWITPCTIAAAQTQCVSFSDTIDGVNKDRAVEKVAQVVAGADREMEVGQRRDRSCDRNCGEAAATSLFGEAPFQLMHYFHPIS